MIRARNHVALLLVLASVTAQAGVDTGLPDGAPLPPKRATEGLSSKPTGFADVQKKPQQVPGLSDAASGLPAKPVADGDVLPIHGDSGTGPAMPASVKETSAQIWAKLIKTPPQGKESFETRDQAIKALLAAQHAHQITNLPPIAGTNGEILYPYGQSWPTVVASPLHVTVLLLGKGDKPFQIVNGAPGMWKQTQAMAGSRPEILISPRFSGLHTNLVVTATGPNGQDRTYTFNLVSDKGQYVPMVGFYYPQTMETQWKLQVQASKSSAQKVDAQTVATLPNLNVADLDFQWKVHCAGGGWFFSSSCGSIRPSRVFDDGVQTYIQMPGGLSTHGGLPSILAENGDGKPAIINWRYRDGYFIVDGVPPEIILIAGVGSGAKVVRIRHHAGHD